MSRFSDFGMVCGNFKSVDVGQGVFGGENTIQTQMNVEAALARVQAKVGLIPQSAADEITRKCDVALLDEEEYRKQFQITKHVLMCLIRTYNNICDDNAGQYIHFGATTQEIVDTAMILQLKQAYGIIETKSRKLSSLVKARAKEYRSLICMGRTNGQQAMPVTLGYRIASWADELNRSIERMEQAKDRIFVGSFFGAVGTLASLKDTGLDIQKGLMDELGLGIPITSWYASRDRLAELINIFCLLVGTLGRIGNEVYVSSMSEIGELVEKFTAGTVGSSTMPHKRNPVGAYSIVSNARLSRSVAIDGLTVLENVDERDGRSLAMECEPLTKICLIADATLDMTTALICGIEAHKENIERNLNLSGGLVYSEALVMRLSNEYGRLKAHELIYEIAQASIEEKKSFREALEENEDVMKKIGKQELHEIMNPANYIGLAEAFVDRVVNQ